MMHLDSQYRDRWQEYHLATGETADSRKINWRQVEWEKVVRVDTHLKQHTYSITCQNPAFQFFMVFRWGGQRPVYKHGKFDQYEAIRIWTAGWTDGEKCYLEDYDFKSGMLIKKYASTLQEFKAHIHPRIAKGVIHD